MEGYVEIKWNPKVQKGLKRIPDKTLFHIASETLDMSYPMIPMSNIKGHAGTLRRSSKAGGVRGGHGDYYIGSYTKYAKYVWNMENVNWTTPGTNNKWFARTLKKHGQVILNNAITKARKEEMQ